MVHQSEISNNNSESLNLIKSRQSMTFTQENSLLPRKPTNTAAKSAVKSSMETGSTATFEMKTPKLSLKPLNKLFRTKAPNK